MVASIIIFLLVIGSVILIIWIKILYGMLKWKNSQFNAVQRNYLFFNEWMDKKRKNSSRVVKLLLEKGYKTVAIYGAGELGIQLYRELYDSNVKVECFIDKSKTECGINIPIYSLDDQIPEIDVVIVSVLHSWELIQTSINKKIQGEIIFLEELI